MINKRTFKSATLAGHGGTHLQSQFEANWVTEQVLDQPKLYDETLSQEQTKTKNKSYHSSS